MEIKIDGIVKPELKEYLLSQEGINDVDINYDEYCIKINIEMNEKTTPNIVMKYINLFQDYKYSRLEEFKKDYKGKKRVLKYSVNDMCCEHCYMKLVEDLFNNDKIISFKSNYNPNYPQNLDLNFIIEYTEDYSEEKLIDYINNNIIN